MKTQKLIDANRLKEQIQKEIDEASGDVELIEQLMDVIELIDEQPVVIVVNG